VIGIFVHNQCGETVSRRFGRARMAAPALAAALLAGAAFGLSSHASAQILLEADEIVYDSESGVVSARGNVEISEPGRVLRADSVTYDPDTDVVGAMGNVSVTDDSGNVAFADRVELTGDLREGALQGFSALLGENGRLAASTSHRWDRRYTEANGATFTSCILCEEDPSRPPVWQIRAARIVHDELEKELVFEDATFEFLGVPILYAPFFSQADPTVRHKSGLLLPTIGTSTYLGTSARVPYYISMGPSRDLTIEPYFTTGAGFVLGAEFRQRFENGGFWLQGSFGTDPDSSSGPGGNDSVGHIFGSGRFSLPDDWRTGFDLELTTNDTYLYRYDISYIDRLTSDFFVDQVRDRNRFAATAYYFQSLREGDFQGGLPLVLPLIEYTYIPETRILGGRMRVDTSALYLHRDIGTDMGRGSFSADWLRMFITDEGHVFTVDTLLRGDLYHINDRLLSDPSAPFDNDTLVRGLGYAALEWRWPFVGRAGFGETSLVIEPIAQLVLATGGGNPEGLPNEDSTTFEFDETNLFDPNEFPGLDLWTGGPRSNLGVRATAFFEHGSIEATLGQEFRSRRDPNFTPGSGVGDTRSDIVGRLKIQFPPYLDLTHRFRLDPVRQTLRRNEIYLTGAYGRSTVEISYLKLSQETTDPGLGPREELNLTGILNVTGNWSVFAETRHDLQINRWLDAGLGVIYEDECFIAQVGYRNRQTTERDLRPSSSVIVRFGLKTGLMTGL
jgi:LPS-assembly protein